jgi:hypothetical protein
VRRLTNADFKKLAEGDLVRVYGGSTDLMLFTHLVELITDANGNVTRADECVTPNYWEFVDTNGVARVGFIPSPGQDNALVVDQSHGSEYYFLEGIW